MPNGIFPVPEFDYVSSRAVRMRPGLAVRVRRRWRRSRLDDELARGTDPSTSAELSLRAAQLRSSAERSRVANKLVETLGDARGPNLGAFRINTRRQHAKIRQYADDLQALVLRLRDDRPIDVQGAAMTARLVDSGASPLHREGGQGLQVALLAARDALEVTHRDTYILARAA
jgi:hypothetical protein